MVILEGCEHHVYAQLVSFSFHTPRPLMATNASHTGRWMLGFRPLLESDPQLKANEKLAEVNRYLADYKRWDELIDAWIVVEVEDIDVIYNWRLEAEQQMREKKGKQGSMTDDQVADFVSRFVPAYKAYLKPFYSQAALDENSTLCFLIDSKRKPKG